MEAQIKNSKPFIFYGNIINTLKKTIFMKL